VLPDAIKAPVKEAADDGAAEAARKVKHVHKVVGKAATYGLEGLLKKAVRFADKDPDDMDDDERELINEGFEELAAQFLGTRKISPVGKVIAGGIAAGFGMYMGAKDLPPKPTPAPAPARQPLQLVDGQQPRGGGDGGTGA